MAKFTLAGHPLHVIFNDFPLGLFPTSFVADSIYLVTRKKKYAEIGNFTLQVGLLGAMAAGVTGFGDYKSIPGSSKHVKSQADTHMLFGLSVVALGALAALSRKRKTPPFSGLSYILSGLMNLAMGAAGWYGGSLVYEYGVRVKGASPTTKDREFKLPKDQRLKERLKSIGEKISLGHYDVSKVSSNSRSL